MRTARVTLVLSIMAAVLLTACGGDSSSGGSQAGESSTAQESRPTLSPSAPITKQLAVTFPVPKVEAGSPPGTAEAIAAGRKACKGKTPVEVREEFIAEAEANLQDGQKEMVEEIGKFEKQASSSPNFAAGQLGAGVYEATLPEKQRIAGFRGCVYELAVQLRRELAKK